MIKKTIIASIITILILVVGGGIWYIQKKIIIEKGELSKYIQSYELKNTIAESRESLEEGFKMLFDKEPNLEGINHVPNLSIKLKEEMYFYGYIMDKYNNIISKARTYPSQIENGKEVMFYWDTAKEVLNGEYDFYVELYKENEQEANAQKMVMVIKSKPIKINIQNNNPPKGFYVISPPSITTLSGLHYSINMNEKPIITWTDTSNVKVVKYQIFEALPSLNPGLNPIIDNIPPDSRKIWLSKTRLKERRSPNVKGPEGFRVFVIRAVLKNGKCVDTNEGGPIEYFNRTNVPELLLE